MINRPRSHAVGNGAGGIRTVTAYFRQFVFSSLHHSQKSFVVSNQLREQQGELTSTWDLMLQTRINLSRSAVRMMMDSSNQQSNAKVELLDSARKTLARPRRIIKNSKAWHRYLKWSLPAVILMKNIKTITQR